MDKDRDAWTVTAMRTYGGSFVKQLAELAAHADSDNLRKIKMTWGAYWAHYEEWGVMLENRGNKIYD